MIRSPQDFAGGIMLLVIAAAGLFGSWELPFGQISGIGSGMVPHTVAVLIAAFGVLLIAQGFLATNGEAISPWAWRGALYVLGAAVVFAWTVRPLGLAIAAPLTIIIASLADRTTRLVEIVIFAVVITAFCIGLFSFALRLPIPIFPSALPYPLNLFL